MLFFVNVYSQDGWKTVWIWISWLPRSQLIKIYTVFVWDLSWPSMRRVNTETHAVSIMVYRLINIDIYHNQQNMKLIENYLFKMKTRYFWILYDQSIHTLAHIQHIYVCRGIINMGHIWRERTFGQMSCANYQFRPPDLQSPYLNISFLIAQPKYMLSQGTLKILFNETVICEHLLLMF